MNSIEKALELALRAHKGQVDRDGEAYILHPMAVCLMGRTDEERCAGLLHDVLEDSDVTSDMLLDEGMSESVVGALELLTHEGGVEYMDYVQGIVDSKNPIAIRVKFNDLTHNFERGKAYPDLQEKHGRALEVVRVAVEEMERVGLYEVRDEVEYAVFAAGCFWGVQHYFDKLKGVIKTYVGYTGGKEEWPSYESVRSHNTTHVEAVLVEYDSNVVSYEELCKLFFEIHDPGQTDGQGPDKGMQYLSGVFYVTEEQKNVTDRLISLLRDKGYEVNTMVRSAERFWIAEGYHQGYYDNTGGSPYCHIRQRKF